MTNFRHLTWMLIAAIGLVFSTTQSNAQKRPDVDEPGLVADDGWRSGSSDCDWPDLASAEIAARDDARTIALFAEKAGNDGKLDIPLT